MNRIVAKMMKKYRTCCLLIIAVLTVFLNYSCEDNLLKGQLVGYVELVDCKGTLLSDWSRVEVIADDGISALSVLSDEDGYFDFDDLLSATYNISLKKEGFGEYLLPGYTFVGGSMPAAIRYIRLYELVEGEIQDLTLSDTAGGVNLREDIYLQASGSITGGEDRNPRAVRYYLNNTSDVSYSNYMDTKPVDINLSTGEISFSFKIDTVVFPVGTDLYMIIYPQTNGLNYINPEDGTRIYYNVNTNYPSEVVSITVPNRD